MGPSIWCVALAAALALPTLRLGAGEALASDGTATAANEFALDLCRQLAPEQGNVFASPLSIWTALAMTSGGARGQTLEQMRKVLHLDGTAKTDHAAIGALLDGLSPATGKPETPYDLAIANSLWGQSGLPFDEAFLKLTETVYHAKLSEVDFRRDTESPRRAINARVAKQTRDKIQDLIARDVLGRDTALVLANAIYFKGKWELPFKKDLTSDGTFRVTARLSVSAPMMRQTGRFKYLETDALQALEMPYTGERLSMLVLLPKTPAPADLSKLESSLSPKQLAEWTRLMAPHEVRIFLPRFTMSQSLSLKEALSAMGMPRAFANADFSGICAAEQLALSAVVHKAFVDVNEEGTEAAGATGVVMGRTAVIETPIFRADHPFLLLIRDRQSGAILFMGRLADPT